MSTPLIKYLVGNVSTEKLVEYMKDPAYNKTESYCDIMFEELRQRGIFLDEKNLELIKEQK